MGHFADYSSILSLQYLLVSYFMTLFFKTEFAHFGIQNGV